MTVKEAVNLYSKKFGGFPWEIVCGCTDEEIVKRAIEAVKTGKEIVGEPNKTY